MTPPPLNLVEQIDATSAEEFLDFLTPHRGGHLWDRIDHRAWIFRGQGDARWKLVPKAHRPPDPFHSVGLRFANINPIPPQSIEEQIDMEESFAMGFASRAGDMGYEIPWDCVELRDRDFAVERHDGSNFPPPRQRGIYALAQHYGVPTRLLDWSTRPLVAAYFASIGPAKDLHKARTSTPPAPASSGRIAVWALNEHFLSKVCRDRDPGVVTVTVPQTSNPNLQRQAGLFTLVRFRTAPVPPTNPPTLDDLLTASDLPHILRKTNGLPPLPMLYKFTLAHEEVPFLLHYLHVAGIDAAAVYAGHGSIVEGMGENRFRSVCTREERVRWKRRRPPGP